MGKTRNCFRKIRDTKGTFHARIGMIKDKNGKGQTKAKEIKKTWQEYTKELLQKRSNDLENHDDVVTHLEPDSRSVKSRGP